MKNPNWINILGNNEKNIVLAAGIYSQLKKVGNASMILSAVMSRINEETAETKPNPVNNFAGHPELAEALEEAGLIEFHSKDKYGDKSPWSYNSEFLDHVKLEESGGDLDVIGKVSSITIDQNFIDKMQILINHDIFVCIEADRTHYPGYEIELWIEDN